MFKIQSTRDIAWPSFSLRKGENVFPSRRAVPVELWGKLDRFRGLKLLDFEGKAEAGKDEGVKLDELSQKQLYGLSKADLVELAKSSGVLVAEDASKSTLLAELEKKLSPGAIASAPQGPTAEQPTVTRITEGEIVSVKRTRGGRPEVSEG